MKLKIFYIFFVGLLFFNANFSYASTVNVNGLVFTTEPQTIKPNEISKDITVQTQNSSGTAEKVDETNDTTFMSSSPTGQFLNSSGNPVSTTMSKNTSSRTFYYKDSSEGTFTISISIKGRDTGTTFSKTQQIIVSSNAQSPNPDTGNSTSTQTNATSSATTTSTSNTQASNYSGSYIYSYSSGTPLSHFSENDFDLMAYAGRDRVAFVNSPVEFDAQIKTINSLGTPNYLWSFGDGSSSSNKTTEHYYIYPGVYNVILNVSTGFSDAVSAAKIEILDPNISVSFLKNSEDSFLQIINNSDREINLAGYRIFYGGKNLVISPDTILSANSSIKIPIQASNQEKILVTYPNGKKISEITTNLLDEIKVTEIKSQILDIQNKISELEEKAARTPDIQDFSQVGRIDIPVEQNQVEPTLTQDTTVENLPRAPSFDPSESTNQEPKNFLDTLLATPEEIFNFIKW